MTTMNVEGRGGASPLVVHEGGQGASSAQLRELLAAEVRAWMGRRKVTGEQLAAHLGASGTYVSRRLRGKTAFDTDDLLAIAAALRVSPEELIVPALRQLESERAAADDGPERTNRASSRNPINSGCCDSAGPGLALAPIRRPGGTIRRTGVAGRVNGRVRPCGVAPVAVRTVGTSDLSVVA